MIAIIEYNAGNIASVKNAIERLGHECIITADHDAIRAADRVIFPGVGEAGTAMKHLREHGLDRLLQSLTQPVLGVCLGLQLLCRHTEEGDTDCLAVFDANVRRFPPIDIVPHVGWNNLSDTKTQLFADFNQDADTVYFVHSYYADICADTIAVCDYILPFSAAMRKNNFYATQFHPEKSAGVGERILRRFVEDKL